VVKAGDGQNSLALRPLGQPGQAKNGDQKSST
jgi:hypothetical protein